MPTLLGLPIGSPEARAATLALDRRLTSLLLSAGPWAAFSSVASPTASAARRTLMLTMVLYAVGTALCALAPNIWVLALFRLIAALGIGGEWAAGAAMVAEVVPEKRRVGGRGAALHLGAGRPLPGDLVNFQIAGVYFRDHPELSWRIVFLAGLLPAAVALVVRRLFLSREPERWWRGGGARPPRPGSRTSSTSATATGPAADS